MQLAAASSGKIDFVRQLEAVWPERAASEANRRPPAGAESPRLRRTGGAPPANDTLDRPRDFCGSAADLLNGALVACEERFPVQGENSVLLVVVDREAERWREQLRSLEEKFLVAPPGAGRVPGVKLEVLDRATADLLHRLADAGVVNPSVRASRQLYPAPAANGAVLLTPAEQEHAHQARERHARKVKMARVLLGETMIEEARAALLEALWELGRALAIEHRLPEPASSLAAVAPPLDRFWVGSEGDSGGLARLPGE